MDINQPIILGQIGSPFGVKGWLKIQSDTQPTANIFSYQPWQLRHNDQILDITVEKQKQQGNDLLIKFKNCDDRDAAKRFVNYEIIVNREQLPDLPSNQFYWSQLENLDVINTEQVSLGKVDSLFNTGSNDIMMIKSQTKTHYVPFLLDNTVKQVDLDNGIITVEWDPEF